MANLRCYNILNHLRFRSSVQKRTGGNLSDHKSTFVTTRPRMSGLTTYREVLQNFDQKVCHSNPLPAETYIKFEQDWPANKENKADEKDSPDSGEQKKNYDKAQSSINPPNKFSEDKYTPVTLVKREELNEHTRLYTFEHSLESIKSMNISIGQHIQCGFMTESGIVERPYAVASPAGAEKDKGQFSIVVKTYFPSEKDPGGTVSNILDGLDSNRTDEMLIRGPEGPVKYSGNGKFSILHKEDDGGEKNLEFQAERINFISGGTGMTPIYTIIRAALETDRDEDIQIRFLDANPTEDDILLDDRLNELEKKHTRFSVIHVVENPSKEWTGETGLIDNSKLKQHLFHAEEGTLSLICGPPPMQKIAREGLEKLDFVFGRNAFCF